MSTKVILLERVEKLGDMGEVVSVKPGFARNFLLPQKKALRANDSNVAYFESQKKHLQAENDKRKAEAQKEAKKLEGLKVALIRAASEAGHLYGSVNARDIAEAASEKSGVKIARSKVTLDRNYKEIGLFPVKVTLHPEVIVELTVNIARSQEEADIQAETGKALVADDEENIEDVVQAAEENLEADLEDVLEEGALEAEKERQAEEAEKEAEDAAKAEERAAKKAEKEAEKAASEEAIAESEAAEESEAETAEDADKE